MGTAGTYTQRPHRPTAMLLSLPMYLQSMLLSLVNDRVLACMLLCLNFDRNVCV